MSAHVLLNLLNKLLTSWGRDKMQGLPSISSLLHNQFIEFNTKGARMFYSIYYMTLKLFLIYI